MTTYAARRRTARSLLAVAVAAVLVWASGTVGVPASAATIPGAVTAVSVVPDDPAPGQSVRLDLTWAVPDTARGGDTFTLDLPGELNRITTSFALADESGATVATAQVTDGLVTFTLTDFVDTHTDVHGTAFFWVQLSHEVAPGEALTLDFGSVTTVITPSDPGDGGGDPGDQDRDVPYKRGSWWDEETGQWGVEGDLLVYLVETPVGPFDRVTVDDRLGAGQSYVCDGALAPQVYLYGIDPDTGHYSGTVTRPPADRVSVDCGEDGLRVAVLGVPADTLVGVMYRVRVTDPDREYYTNTASVTADQQTQQVEALVERTGAGGDGSGQLPGPEPEPDPEPDPEPQPEPDPEPDPEPQPEPDPQPQPEPDPQPAAAEQPSGVLAVTGSDVVTPAAAAALVLVLSGVLLVLARRRQASR